MKIGVMLRNIGEMGGIVVYAKNLLNNLFRIDTENEYYLLYKNKKDFGSFSDYKNVREYFVESSNKIFWDQLAVPSFAKKNNIDLIFNPKLSIPILTKSKTVWVMHGGAQFVVPQCFKLLDRIYFNVANRIYAKKATAVITMTKLGAKDIVKYMGVDSRKMHVIHESYNENCRLIQKSDELNLVKVNHDLPDKYILFVGGITPLKNFGNLIRAYSELSSDIPHKLVVAGFNRWKFSSDLDLIKKLNLQHKVTFLGFVSDEDLPCIYRLADLFVFPSLYEGFGIPILEAMACGCPVITSRTGCSPEVAGNAAILVNPYDYREIGDEIKKVILDNSLKESLVQAGFERVKEFSWEKCAKETLNLFNKVGNS